MSLLALKEVPKAPRSHWKQEELLLHCYYYVTPRLEEGVEGVLVVAEEERVVAHRAHGQP